MPPGNIFCIQNEWLMQYTHKPMIVVKDSHVSKIESRFSWKLNMSLPQNLQIRKRVIYAFQVLQ